MKTYRVIAHLITLGVVLQAMWIALGNFTMFHGLDSGEVLDKSWHGNYATGLHGLFGIAVIPLLAIALFITAFFVKAPHAVRWAGYVLGDVVLQIALVFAAFSIPVFGALHGLNAFGVLALAHLAARRGTAPAADVVESPGAVAAA